METAVAGPDPGKVMSMAGAMRRLVPDGAVVALGTALECLIPFAAAHELIRQGRRDLTLVGPISDICFDQLIAAGCARRVVAAWVGNVQHGSGYAFRRAVEQGVPGPLEVEDHSNLTLALSLEAAATGVLSPHADPPGHRHPGPEYPPPRGPLPVHGVPLVLVPAIAPDVAILHVQRADPGGSCHVWGPTGVSRAAGKAARRVVVVCEELVDPAVIRRDPDRTLLPGFLVSAVVHLPWAAHPSPVQGHYNRDHGFYGEYHRHSASAEGAVRWLDDSVRSVPDHAAYLARVGRARLDGLRPRAARLAPPVDYAS